MWEIHIVVLNFIAKIVQVQYIGPIVIILFFLSFLKIFRFFSIILLSSYLLFVALFFTFNDFGLDIIRVYQMKKILIPEAYMSYRQDFELMKTFMQKRWFSYYTYQNMKLLNKKFKIILNYLEEEKENIPKISEEKIEKINLCQYYKGK